MPFKKRYKSIKKIIKNIMINLGSSKLNYVFLKLRAGL